MSLRLGIDTGGTFTDLVLLDDTTGEIATAKVPSTPRDPAAAITDGLAALILTDRVDSTVVGTTIATNAVIQRRGPRLVFVTNEGFEDVPFIGRIDKEHLYDLDWEKPRPLVERRHALGVDGRVDRHGVPIEPISAGSLDRLRSTLHGLPSDDETVVAVSLLFSYLAPEHEHAVREAIGEALPTARVSLSHEVSPTWREYERANTTLVDAFVKPAIGRYVEHLDEIVGASSWLDDAWCLLGSNGGYLAPAEAERLPAQLIVSGLAGGVIGGRHAADAAGVAAAFTLDMGGTSCDLGLILGREQQYTVDFEIEWGLPVTVPCVAVRTIGAGGGSIAWIDKGGLLHVGPHSAGADPGPVAYGRGGTAPTVTDANLVLGRLDPDYFLGGAVRLDLAAAERAFEALGGELGLTAIEAAAAAVETADENMANAIRLIAVEHGLDARELALVAFGGAGPLHARAVAAALGIRTVVVPIRPGLCSALGCAISEPRVDRVATFFARSDSAAIDGLRGALLRLERDATEGLRRTAGDRAMVVRRSADVRYAGQNHELELPLDETPSEVSDLLQRFHELHEATYGYALAGHVVEIVNLRVTARVEAPVPAIRSPRNAGPGAGLRARRVWLSPEKGETVPVLRRDTLAPATVIDGPAIVEEVDSTTVLLRGDRATVTGGGTLTIEVGQEC